MAGTNKLQIWSDLDPAIVADPEGKLKLNVNVDAVAGSIDNIIRTSPGERLFLPQFALGLRNMVFEPISDALRSRLADQIKNEVEIWDPRVNVAGLDFHTDTDNNFVSITVRFTIVGFSQTFSTTTVVT